MSDLQGFFRGPMIFAAFQPIRAVSPGIFDTSRGVSTYGLVAVLSIVKLASALEVFKNKDIAVCGFIGEVVGVQVFFVGFHIGIA